MILRLWHCPFCGEELARTEEDPKKSTQRMILSCFVRHLRYDRCNRQYNQIRLPVVQRKETT